MTRMNVGIFWVLHPTYLGLETVLQQSLPLLSSKTRGVPISLQVTKAQRTDRLDEKDAGNTGMNTLALAIHNLFARCF